MSTEFNDLFTPLNLGPVTLPNRIFMSAGNTGYFRGVDPPSDRAISFYETRAAGGAGLIITGQHHPYPVTTASGPTAYASDDVIPALSRVAEAIHRHGTKCFGQLNHPGTGGPARPAGGGATWSVSSPVHRRRSIHPGGQEPGHTLSIEDLKRVVDCYAAAAVRFKKAGYDGVEVRAVIGLLQAQFLSPAMNIRTDEYGGDVDNRTRLLIETISAVRDAVGPDFVVGTRFTGDEFLDWTWWSKEPGNTLEGGIEIAKRLAASGKLTYLFPCAGTIYPPHVPSMYYPLGAFVYMPAEIKKVVDLPVFGIGRVNDPVLANEIIASGQADMVGMFRGLVADPEFPKKAREGRAEDIRRCVGCNEGCTGHIGFSMPLSCTVNVQAGREKTFIINPADVKKRVMVVGAGGAGLETARMAALRGHTVTLYDKADTLAKDLTIASKAPGRDGWGDVIRYYTHQLNRLEVDIRLGVMITPESAREMIRSEGYDAVVIATGADPFIPKVPGMDNAGFTVAEARDVLEGTADVGETVLLVVYENHSVGVTAADFLADKGKAVELITESLFAGPQLDISTSETLYSRLLAKGVVITPLTGLKRVEGRVAVVHNVLTGAERRIEGVDTLVLAVEGVPNDALYRALKDKVTDLHMAGQCVSPRRLLDSIHDGARVGNAL